jgi:NADP-dependent aldehyde dehydrogenase
MDSILINGQWQETQAERKFQAIDPRSSKHTGDSYPVSGWNDCDSALEAAKNAALELEEVPSSKIADFLECYAKNLELNAEEICNMASLETGLPLQPRLLDVEMPRTTNQLRQAAQASRQDCWRNVVHDEDRNIHSGLGPIGPVLIFGPNNFPLAFNAISGGDFASAIAAGNPVIAKAHPSQPGTSHLLAKQAAAALHETGLPAGMVQMIFDTEPANGLRMVADERLGAVAFTGSRPGGMALKNEADRVGKPIYLEMSSVNPVFLLGSALKRNGDMIDEASGSCLLGAGQFCTCPNLIVVQAGADADTFLNGMTQAFESKPAGTLLSRGVLQSMEKSVKRLREAGVKVMAGGEPVDGDAVQFSNTLLHSSADNFLANPGECQTEAFGPCTLIVTCQDSDQMLQVASSIEGSLTAVVYGEPNDELTGPLTRALRRIAGRVLHNQMPTGVAVSPAMNHGGPFPATGHPGFTAVGIPASMKRFAKLDCYENVSQDFLPAYLQTSSTTE